MLLQQAAQATSSGQDGPLVEADLEASKAALLESVAQRDRNQAEGKETPQRGWGEKPKVSMPNLPRVATLSPKVASSKTDTLVAATGAPGSRRERPLPRVATLTNYHPNPDEEKRHHEREPKPAPVMACHRKSSSRQGTPRQQALPVSSQLSAPQRAGQQEVAAVSTPSEGGWEDEVPFIPSPESRAKLTSPKHPSYVPSLSRARSLAQGGSPPSSGKKPSPLAMGHANELFRSRWLVILMKYFITWAERVANPRGSESDGVMREVVALCKVEAASHIVSCLTRHRLGRLLATLALWSRRPSAGQSRRTRSWSLRRFWLADPR